MAKNKTKNEHDNVRNTNSKSDTAVVNPAEKTEKANRDSAKTEKAKEPAKNDRAVRSDETKIAFSPEKLKEIAISALKILLPVAACVIVIAVIVSYAGSKKNIVKTDDSASNAEENPDAEGAFTLSQEPLKENAYTDVNELMGAFYTALAGGDMDTVRALKDDNTDKEIITYEERSKFIEAYNNVNCYTKPGLGENTYFAYVSYDIKIKDIETKAAGLEAWYVYTAEDGSLKIEDVDEEETVYASFKLITVQDDVVDLFNKIDVSYKEAIASDEALNSFMTELPTQIKTSVGAALAQLEEQNTENGDTQADEPQPAETEAAGENAQPAQNQTVNQIVKTTATVNVRSSDSEEADKIGKAQTGSELIRIEERINGWSKVIFEEKEAYIKSDYLEVVSAEPVSDPIGTVKASTNVNVRSRASQDSDKIGTAQTGNSYELLEDQGEWFKINYNGKTGFVKAEFFDR